MKLIHISDIHFTAPKNDKNRVVSYNDGYVERPRQYSWRKSKLLVDFLVAKKQEFGTNIVVITGDLTDSGDEVDYTDDTQIDPTMYPDATSESKRGVNHFVDKLTANGFEVYVVPGNHDYCKEGLQILTSITEPLPDAVLQSLNIHDNADMETRRGRFLQYFDPYIGSNHKRLMKDNGQNPGRRMEVMLRERKLDGSDIDFSGCGDFNDNDYPYFTDITDKDGNITGRLILLDSMQGWFNEDKDKRALLAQGSLGNSQIKKLRKMIDAYQPARAQGKKLVVAMHHSPFDVDDNAVLTDRNALRETIQGTSDGKGRIDGLLFGHTTPPNIFQQGFPKAESDLKIGLINCENIEFIGCQYPITLLEFTDRPPTRTVTHARPYLLRIYEVLCMQQATKYGDDVSIYVDQVPMTPKRIPLDPKKTWETFKNSNLYDVTQDWDFFPIGDNNEQGEHHYFMVNNDGEVEGMNFGIGETANISIYESQHHVGNLLIDAAQYADKGKLTVALPFFETDRTFPLRDATGNYCITFEVKKLEVDWSTGWHPMGSPWEGMREKGRLGPDLENRI